jgi:hypothetical protein
MLISPSYPFYHSILKPVDIREVTLYPFSQRSQEVRHILEQIFDTDPTFWHEFCKTLKQENERFQSLCGVKKLLQDYGYFVWTTMKAIVY